MTAVVTKIWMVGDWNAEIELRAALANRSDLDPIEDASTAEAVALLTSGDALNEELARVREHSHAPIVLIAQSPASPRLLETALEAEVAEVLILPQLADAVAFAVQKAVASAARRDSESHRSHVVTVFSPKGGTGKSVIACNVADALAHERRRVLLIDLDLQFGDVAVMLGLQPERSIHELLTAPGPLDVDKIAGYATRVRPGLDVLAAPFKPEDAESISEARVGELVKAARAGYDAVIIDTAPFFQGAFLTTLDRTDTLLTVCTPDVPAMKNVRLALQTLRLLAFPEEKVRLVLNRANDRLGFRGAQVASVLEHDVAYELPEDETVSIAVNRATTANNLRPDAPFSRAVLTMCMDLRAGRMPRQAQVSRPRRFSLGRRG